ncbi:MAG: arylsulfatase [Planctomycetales bacterium]|nr:arylsulfatase [Planctomycetales bacterium]
MKRMSRFFGVIFFFVLTSLANSESPNVIFVMADDLGYGDLGCYGQQLIQTPHLDQIAKDGIRFTQFYAGCTVCASSRSVLMTGQHMGHTHVRGNAGGDISIQSLRPEDYTLAELFHDNGYLTGMFGKWGLGDEVPNNTGLPNDQGFDEFYGYLNQVHAHNYYPEFLWRNRTRSPLNNVVQSTGSGYGGFAGGFATQRNDYAHDLIMNEAFQFIRQNHDRPFFAYIPITIPHANNEGTRGTGNGQEVPDYGSYADKDWSDQNKGQAAMISRLDRDMGRLLELLQELEIDNNTIVFFTSDNGPHNEGGHTPKLFNPSGPLKGMKRALYEGGIRVPMIVRWPGQIEANQVSDHIAYFGDMMATCAELANTQTPKNTDSISFVPTLQGRRQDQQQHQYLYWEFYEQGSKQAVRSQNWKAIRKPMFSGKTELYNLDSDIGETTDVAQQHPDIVARLEAMMDEAHVPHPNWKVPAPRGRQ